MYLIIPNYYQITTSLLQLTDLLLHCSVSASLLHDYFNYYHYYRISLLHYYPLLPLLPLCTLVPNLEMIVQLMLRHLTTPLWEDDAARLQHVCAANGTSRQPNVCRSARCCSARRLRVRADCLRRR